MREAVPFLFLVGACGALVSHPDPGTPVPAFRAVAGGRESIASPRTSHFDDLAARTSAVASGMHEILRSEGDSDLVLLHPERRDVCVRAAFDASAPVVARLVDAERNVLATTDAPARSGVLGGHGPVCVRKGETMSAVVEPAGTPVRWMAWAAGP